MCCAAGPGDDDPDAALGGGAGEAGHLVRGAVRRHDVRLERDAEFGEDLRRGPHGRPVGVRPHDDRDERLCGCGGVGHATSLAEQDPPPGVAVVADRAVLGDPARSALVRSATFDSGPHGVPPRSDVIRDGHGAVRPCHRVRRPVRDHGGQSERGVLQELQVALRAVELLVAQGCDTRSPALPVRHEPAGEGRVVPVGDDDPAEPVRAALVRHADDLEPDRGAVRSGEVGEDVTEQFEVGGVGERAHVQHPVLPLGALVVIVVRRAGGPDLRVEGVRHDDDVPRDRTDDVGEFGRAHDDGVGTPHQGVDRGEPVGVVLGTGQSFAPGIGEEVVVDLGHDADAPGRGGRQEGLHVVTRQDVTLHQECGVRRRVGAVDERGRVHLTGLGGAARRQVLGAPDHTDVCRGRVRAPTAGNDVPEHGQGHRLRWGPDDHTAQASGGPADEITRHASILSHPGPRTGRRTPHAASAHPHRPAR
ncbi:hypothetical protein CURTO8I2_140102 [Curtobacterium sp. 8I-2]|nr:hypothetical protein CURTO8I2_140102 [Curtobacterium sp. 8I-2]